MNGVLNVYFPGELKRTRALRQFSGRWQQARDRQLHVLHNRNRPLTDLLDLQTFRHENDAIQNQLKESLQFELYNEVIERDCERIVEKLKETLQ